eukprot:Skav235628  [mRNA]  locus=scaffold358:332667:337724:- [translate_table: standard]
MDMSWSDFLILLYLLISISLISSAGFSGILMMGSPLGFLPSWSVGSFLSRFSIWKMRAASSCDLETLLWSRVTVFLVKDSSCLLVEMVMESSCSLSYWRKSILSVISSKRTGSGGSFSSLARLITASEAFNSSAVL